MPCPIFLPLSKQLNYKPKILFVCVGNACRSQMAEGFAKNLSQGKFEIFSAGSRPAGFVSREAIEAMQELGIDISKHYSKGLNQIPPEKYDAIVTMGCGDACPHLPARQRFDWQIPDPVGASPESFREVRDLIQKKVQELFAEVKGEK